MNETTGFDEVLAVIGKVLEEQQSQSKVVIGVAADTAEELRKQTQKIISSYADDRIEIVSDQDIGPGDCRINWKDGGAVRDSVSTARKIESALEQLLAARGAKVRYSKSDEIEDADKDKQVPDEAEPIQPRNDDGDTL